MASKTCPIHIDITRNTRASIGDKLSIGGSRTGEAVSGIEIARQASRVTSLASGSGSWSGERIEEAVIARTGVSADVKSPELICIASKAGCCCVGSAVEAGVMTSIANTRKLIIACHT